MVLALKRSSVVCHIGEVLSFFVIDRPGNAMVGTSFSWVWTVSTILVITPKSFHFTLEPDPKILVIMCQLALMCHCTSITLQLLEETIEAIGEKSGGWKPDYFRPIKNRLIWDQTEMKLYADAVNCTRFVRKKLCMHSCFLLCSLFGKWCDDKKLCVWSKWETHILGMMSVSSLRSAISVTGKAIYALPERTKVIDVSELLDLLQNTISSPLDTWIISTARSQVV